MRGGQVVLQRPLPEEARRLRLARRVRAEPHVRGRIDQLLREGMRLREPEPVVVAEREGHVRPLEVLDGRHDVHDGQALHPVRAVNRQAVRDAGAAVVRHHLEAAVAHERHQFRHVPRHAAFGIRGVVGARGGLEAAAVAAQVRADDGVAPRQGRGGGVPHGVGLRVAVQQQERRAGAAVAQAQLPVLHPHLGQREAVEEPVHASLHRRVNAPRRGRLAGSGGGSIEAPLSWTRRPAVLIRAKRETGDGCGPEWLKP